MLVLNPRRVSFDGVSWERVVSVSIGRSSEKLIVEWGDDGPHTVMVDVPEQKVTVSIVQELLGEDMDEPRPGDEGTLLFTTAGSSTDTPGKRVSMTAVVASVEYEVSVRRGSQRKVKLVAVSSNGSSDPVSVTTL